MVFDYLTSPIIDVSLSFCIDQEFGSVVLISHKWLKQVEQITAIERL